MVTVQVTCIAAAGSNVVLATIRTVQNLRLADNHDLSDICQGGAIWLIYPVSRAATCARLSRVAPQLHVRNQAGDF